MGTEKVFIDGEEYSSLWPETKQCKIYYHHLCEDLVGYLSGADEYEGKTAEQFVASNQKS